MEKGEAPDCFATQWMTASQESQGMDDIEGAFIAGSELDVAYATISDSGWQPQWSKLDRNLHLQPWSVAWNT